MSPLIACHIIWDFYYNNCYVLCVSTFVYVHVCVCVCVGSCLATKVFIGNLPVTGRGWVIIK